MKTPPKIGSVWGKPNVVSTWGRVTAVKDGYVMFCEFGTASRFTCPLHMFPEKGFVNIKQRLNNQSKKIKNLRDKLRNYI